MRLAGLAVLALAGCGGDTVPSNAAGTNIVMIADAESVELRAADGVAISGLHTLAMGRPRALILLFHQAESSKSEYGPEIGVKLAASGYSSLAIDQRSGGTMFGPNETVDALGKSADYRAAKADLEAALAWARVRGLPVVLWGSSYSASLAFVVAAEHPGEVAAVMAFSPGEYFDGDPDVGAAAARVTAPVFVTSAPDRDEVAAASALMAVAPARFKRQFVPEEGGAHGSSTLRRDRNPGGADAAWHAVLAFLAEAVRS
jgi:pimeloyl-ACP methyl ester carboxylesterase